MNVSAYEGVSEKAANVAAQQKIAEGIKDNGLGDGGGMIMGMNVAAGMNPLTGNMQNKDSSENVKEKIEISTINQGAGKLNLLIGVPEECYEKAIRNIYRTLENN